MVRRGQSLRAGQQASRQVVQPRCEAKRGNKRKAEERLTELLEKLNRGTDYHSESLTPAERERLRLSNSPVDEYLVEWLEDHKRNITTRTYEGYKSYIDQRIVPYFREKHILVKDMTGDNINALYHILFDIANKRKSSIHNSSPL